MYLASNVLQHGEDMIFIDQYYYQEDYLISFPRIMGSWIYYNIPLWVLIESICQSGEILCRNLIYNVGKIYLVEVKNFCYSEIKFNDYKNMHYKTSCTKRIGNYFMTYIEIFLNDSCINKIECTHYYVVE